MVGFVHHPMRAMTAGEEEETVALVGRLEGFVEANDDKVVYIHCSGGHGRAVRTHPPTPTPQRGTNTVTRHRPTTKP